MTTQTTHDTPQEVPNPTGRPALVVGKVEYRQGDGPMLAVPVGEVEVVTTAADATLAWQDGQTRGTASMPLTDFRRHVARGCIRLGSERSDPA